MYYSTPIQWCIIIPVPNRYRAIGDQIDHDFKQTAQVLKQYLIVEVDCLEIKTLTTYITRDEYTFFK